MTRAIAEEEEKWSLLYLAADFQVVSFVCVPLSFVLVFFSPSQRDLV